MNSEGLPTFSRFRHSTRPEPHDRTGERLLSEFGFHLGDGSADHPVERMGARIERDGRSVPRAAVGLASLMAMVVAANALWPGPASPDPVPSRLPPDASPFPTFRMGPVLHVMSIGSQANLSTRLLAVSLQGLVNRDLVELYLDSGEGRWNLSAMLSDWEAWYGIVYDFVSLEEALDLYAPRANGTIVFDPSRAESINIGTMLASQRGGLLVGPDLAPWVEASYGLPVLFDYGASDWALLDRIGAYERALAELYPASNPLLLAILPPERWALRDYLIASRTFVFYVPQGILASPFDVAITTRILRTAPRGIPVLGWFDSPTLTEENAFLQIVSQEGKFLVGTQTVPNLSVMTALGRGAPRQQPPPPEPVELGDKTYVVLAIPDGDNLDFLAGRMVELWAEPVRGTVPIAWSMNPLLVELAPPLLDAYYATATGNDRFIAAPSGAGYLYPDYTGPGDLAPFIAFSKRYLEASGMDIVWLLNAFPASEIPYSEASLSAYVDGLRPRGLALDYADQPRTRDAWMHAGAEEVAPVIRSTHFWTTADNALGKIGAAASTWDHSPHFLWLTLYSFRFDLAHVRDLVQVLEERLPGGVEIVAPETFFALLRRDFIRQATEHVSALESDPIATLFFRDALAAARRHEAEAESHLQTGDVDRAAAAAFRGMEEVRAIRAGEAVFLSVLVLACVAVLAGLAAFPRRRAPSKSNPGPRIRIGPWAFIVATVALFMFALREAVQQNFWTYPAILIGLALAPVHRPLRDVLERRWGVRAPAVASLIALIFDSLAIRTSAAFPLALIGSLLALETYLARRTPTSAEAVAGLSCGVAVGFVGGFDLVTLTLVALLLVAPAVRLRGSPSTEPPRPRSSAALSGVLLLLPVSALAVAFSYSLALRLEVQGDRLALLAGLFLVAPSAVAILLRRAFRRPLGFRGTLSGLLGAAILAMTVLAVSGAIATAVALLGLFSALGLAALGSLDDPMSDGIHRRRALSISVWLLPLLVLLLRMPPIVYSLALVPLPEVLEHALYAPTSLIAATSLALVSPIALRRRSRVAEKHYPSGPDARAGDP